MICHNSAYSETSASLFLNKKIRYFMVRKKNNLLFVLGCNRMITICHLSASLVMPIGDPWDRFFYHTITLMINS